MKKESLSKYYTEFIGTFIFAFAIFIALVTGGPAGVPIIAALTLALVVYMLGSFSGAHVNPAVTLGALSINKISINDAVGYIIAQFAGAALALGLGLLIAPELGITNILNAGAQAAAAAAFDFKGIGVAEAIGTAFFTFGIASVIFGKSPKGASGFVVGGSLLLGILMAIASGSGGVLNPAIALATKSFTVVYVLGPIVGSMIGMWAYKLLVMAEEHSSAGQKKEKKKAEK